MQHELVSGLKLGRDFRKLTSNDNEARVRPGEIARTGWIYCTHDSTKTLKGMGCSLCIPVRWCTNVHQWIIGDSITRHAQLRRFCLAHSHPMRSIFKVHQENLICLRHELREEEVSIIQDLAPYGVEPFRVAKILRGKADETKVYDPKLIGRIMQRERERLGLVEDRTGDFFQYAREQARNGGIFEYEVDETQRIRSWLLQDAEMRAMLLAYDDFIILDGTHWVNKFGQILIPPVVVDCFLMSHLGAFILGPAESASLICTHLEQAGVEPTDHSGRHSHLYSRPLMTDEAPCFPLVAEHFKMLHLLCTNHYVTSIPKIEGCDGDFNKDANDAVYEDFGTPERLAQHLGQMSMYRNKTAQKHTEKLSSLQTKLCRTHTKEHFTAGHTTTQRGEGQNSRVKHQGLFKKDLKRMGLLECAKHVIERSRSNLHSAKKKLVPLVQANKLWSDEVQAAVVAKQVDCASIKSEAMQITASKALEMGWPWPIEGYTFSLVTSRRQGYDGVMPNGPEQHVVGFSPKGPPRCTCGFFKSWRLLCTHLCWSITTSTKSELFKPENFEKRWLLQSHPLFSQVKRELFGTSVPQAMSTPNDTSRTIINIGQWTIDEEAYFKVRQPKNQSHRVVALNEIFLELSKAAVNGSEHAYRTAIVLLSAVTDQVKNANQQRLQLSDIVTPPDAMHSVMVSPGMIPPAKRKTPPSEAQEQAAMQICNERRGLTIKCPSFSQAVAKTTGAANNKRASKIGQCRACKLHKQPAKDSHRTGTRCPFYQCKCDLCTSLDDVDKD